jgi:hypothetical protein
MMPDPYGRSPEEVAAHGGHVIGDDGYDVIILHFFPSFLLFFSRLHCSFTVLSIRLRLCVSVCLLCNQQRSRPGRAPPLSERELAAQLAAQEKERVKQQKIKGIQSSASSFLCLPTMMNRKSRS